MISTTELYKIFENCKAVSTDSRSVKEGELFFALKGPAFNGNRYAKSALEKGAMFSVVDEPKFQTNAKMLLVENTLQSLQELSKIHRQQFDIPVIAITGSNGKTTTKELLHHVLKTQYNCLATKGNLNNHIGVPLTLLRINSETEMAIIEMGANHIGEIASYCNWAIPNYGLITNIGKAHLEGFGSIEGVLQGKTELFDYLEKNDGFLFVNDDDKLLAKKSKVFSNRQNYGSNPKNDFHGNLLQSDSYLKLQYNSGGKKVTIHTNLVGDYNFSNALAAICVGKHFNIFDKEISTAIQSYQPDNQRSQMLDFNGLQFIMDSYNANPSSMKLALSNFEKMKTGGKKGVVLGEMKELGKFSKQEHGNIAQIAFEKNFDQLIFVGSEFEKIAFQMKASYFKTRQELFSWFWEQDFKRYTFLLKASRAVGLEDLVKEN